MSPVARRCTVALARRLFLRRHPFLVTALAQDLTPGHAVLGVVPLRFMHAHDARRGAPLADA